MDAPHLLPWCLLLLLLTLAGSNNGVSATAPKPATKAVGFGYRLVSLVQRPNGGGLVGYLQVKQRTSTYGPDIPRLRLFVK
jgi:alpha-D-xyloside xylohydrolase